MNDNEFVDQLNEFVDRLFLTPDPELEDLLSPLSRDQIVYLIDQLKKRADEHWQKKPAHSLEVGELLCKIGKLLQNGWICALGMMACGDASEKLGSYRDAGDFLRRAGDRFWALGDEVGWARTWIVQLAICIDLNCVDETLAQALKAHTILSDHAEYHKLFRLTQGIAIVLDKRGKHLEALDRYEDAAKVAQLISDLLQSEIGDLYANMGVSHYQLGNLQRARELYETARDIYVRHKKDRAVAILDLNIASIDKLQGHYREALERFYRIVNVLNEHLSANTKRSMVECYLYLNCPLEANEMARQAVQSYEKLNMPYEQATTLLYLAWSEAWSDTGDASVNAMRVLDQAESLFTDCFKDQPNDLDHWRAMVSLYRAQIAFRQGDFPVALKQAQIAGAQLRANQQQFHYGSALLLESQARFKLGDLDGAAQQASSVWRIGRQIHTPPHVYGAHLLRGQVAEQQMRSTRAERHYTAAAAIIDRVQQRLTLSLSPVFLEDKGDALRALIRMKLADQRFADAFNLLERMKSQTALSYLLRQSSLPLATENGDMRRQVEEFNQLRTRLSELSQPESLARQGATDDKHREIAECESRLLALSRLLEPLGQVTLNAQQSRSEPVHDAVQMSLKSGTALVEYYINGEEVIAFVLANGALSVIPCASSASDIGKSLDAFRRYTKRTLMLGSTESSLRRQTDQALNSLYTALIEPIEKALQGIRRLIVVPYGFLHYVPFHLLHDLQQYLICRFEVVTLPAASWVTRPAPIRSAGARVLAWSGADERPLVKAAEEADMVCALLGGKPYRDGDAVRARLLEHPVKVLHIASHGKYHHQPDLSYIQLADGALFTAELMQYDLSYELVTLSACETGQSRPSGGDELVGLGRSFIYAGAGALVTSLWRVRDEFAYEFMQHFYQGLRAGHSKAAALATTYQEIISEHPNEHPAFWGTFQLVGNADPLSSALGN